MEHLCYKCGASVEEGTAFCPQCNAPQIRVGIEPDVTLGTDSSLRSAAPGASAAGIQWSQALPSAALAGLIAAFLMFIPLGAFGVSMLAAGSLAVLFYHRRNPARLVTPGIGARVGALGGMLGFAIFAVFAAIEVVVFHGGGALRAAMLEAIQQSAARTSDPQAQQMVEYLKSPAGMALMMGLGLALVFLLFLVLSSLGGAVGAALLRRRNHP